MPDVAITTILVYAVYDGIDSIYLVRTHYEQLLFTGDQNHILADHSPKPALCQDLIGEVLQIGNFVILLVSPLIYRQELFFSVEVEMLVVVICEIVCPALIAHNEQLHKA